MNPSSVYRQERSRGWTRADMLLALLDGGVERLESGAEALRRGDRMTAVRLLTRAELIVCELAAGVDPDYAHAPHFLRLYGLASRAIAATTLEETEAALQILRTVRDTVAGLRDEAVRLEREGTLPPADAVRLVLATA